ncbi:phosphate acetyltransferase [Corynebacterium sp. 320]|uniref:phosphate acetyltransferase n=1 Tax=Corynebacterium TaxID=1716 RepID=UPI00125CAD98|nr:MULTISPECIES: phosphate acetyltransferase [Corynebacterium]KAB1503088.1 phosphate acetyltransferase [Corynebacterium sp. 320]KAB1550701.1 phosphate acetyltransferase [Corynebacterium sp. 321]KAB1551060.1 phosphate acetyltransferase [Corynebacterium sp. 319]KAB3526885.1 phosphate acetyltransferase [Corynebacterium sp. 250]KAB3538378.1 phosphate acetyltransferase [Corynebacterium sp. 366]
MSEAAQIVSVISPIAAAAGHRSDLLRQVDAVDIFDTLRPGALDFSEALEVAYNTTGSVLLGTGETTFDSRLAAACGASHFLVAEPEDDRVALQLAIGKLVRAGRPPQGIWTVGDAYSGSDALESEGHAIPLVDSSAVLSASHRDVVIGPELFERNLILQARAKKAHIVLPEGDDDRILLAAHQLLEDKVCQLTILGDPSQIAARAKELKLDLTGAHLTDPTKGSLLEEFAESFAELRKDKGVTLDEARETMKDISYFATMMVHKGMADGMVSGAAHTTAHTIKPSFQIIKTKPGASTVSSIFLMVMDGVLWAFGDCAVNPAPTSEQLAEIAIVSAETAAQFGIDPKVALLSYSTGTSGSGEAVDRVAAAVDMARDRAPELQLDGPLQFDAAVVESVGQSKMPGSDVAGKATVFVFPDLNAGNITYKAVQRTADALAVGPILQGLNKPVNDLSRGATVPDIVNTVAITAIQAG